MLDVTREDIAALSDADLGGLVERLCEAELARLGLSSAALGLGGAQDAPDGGVDLRVDTDPAISTSGFIPRASTVFQVKATPMSPAKVVAEMRPARRGQSEASLRPAIARVLGEGGAYVMVCSKTAPAGAQLDSLKAKMIEAAGPAMVQGAAVDFIGPDRLVLWCRRHPGVLSWARAAAGRPLQGWLPFGAWSRPDDGVEREFILDREARLIDERSAQEGPLPIEEGLARMRALASAPRKSVRLLGLSGVGKTRLVQALFDARIGSGALAQAQALYCDAGGSVSPDPVEMAQQLASRTDRVVLIVDNCAPELHRQLTQVVELRASPLSLVTVEYDVRDDDMEGTEVFRLEPASEAVTESLIQRRYPHIRGANRRRIADMAGGNARIALALAHTVRRGESLGRLRDEALFERLFYQRARTDADLLTAAEVAALVYSFDAETVDGELVALAALAEQSVVTFKGALAELARRDLLQRRGHWRAVLPHAVANRLAVRALERLTPGAIADRLVTKGERLLRSFSRRLSFLHDVASAADLAAAWFAPGGLLGDVPRFNEFGFDIFRNMAPLAPAAALAAISRGALTDAGWKGFNPYFGTRQSRGYLSELLRALAFDVELFDEAAERLVELSLVDDEKIQSNRSPTTLLVGLFRLHASGTLAPPAQRLAFIDGLLVSADPARVDLGLQLFDVMLETESHGSTEGFDFGARPRGLGWEPAPGQAGEDWFKPALQQLAGLAGADGPLLQAARDLFAKRLRGLWWRAGLAPAVTAAAVAVTGHRFWPEGWIATRASLAFAPKRADAAEVADLKALSALLRPKSLVEEVRTYGAARTRTMSYELDDLEDVEGETPRQRIEVHTLSLGEALAGDAAARAKVLPDLFQGDGQRQWIFGEGLANAAADRRALWDELVATLKAVPPDAAHPGLLRGYLGRWAKLDPTAVEPVLDAVLDDPVLGRWLPFLQTVIDPLPPSGLARITASFDLGHTAAWSYRSLQFGPMDGLDDEAFVAVVEKLAALVDGQGIALSFFHYRTFDKKKTGEIGPAVLALGRRILADFPLGSAQGRQEAYLDEVIALCLAGPYADLATRTLRRMRIAIVRRRDGLGDYSQLVAAIMKTQPQAGLEYFLGAEKAFGQDRGPRWLLQRLDNTHKPLSELSAQDLLAFAAVDPGPRHVRVAEHIPLFRGKVDEDEERWWPPALALLDDAPYPAPVLAAFSEALRPRSWSGSRADILERRAKALHRLDDHASPVVRAWARAQRDQLALEAAADRARPSTRYQAFE
jgi:hypothetical protein